MSKLSKKANISKISFFFFVLSKLSKWSKTVKTLCWGVKKPFPGVMIVMMAMVIASGALLGLVYFLALLDLNITFILIFFACAF